MLRVLWSVIFMFAFCSELSAQKEDVKTGASVSRAKPENSMMPSDLYSYVELRHHINTYYDQDDQRTRQEPTLHARAKIGAMFHQDTIDVFATLGFIKGAQTQQVVQRRPEVEVDIYPWTGTYGQVVQYNIIRLPHTDPQYDASRGESSKEGTVYSVGVASTLIFPVTVYSSSFKPKAGFDYWTDLYSRKQYRNEDEERNHYGLSDNDQNNEDINDDDEGSDGIADSESETKEDSVQRLYTEYMMGFAFNPGWLRNLTTELLGFYDSDYYPVYKETGDGEETYKYVAKRTSHYRARLQYDLSDRTSFINDFYHFHDGFFQRKEHGDERRFRNILRVSYKL